MSWWELLGKPSLEINDWYEQGSEKVKIQSRIEEVNTLEGVRIFHQELHTKKIKKTSILKLQTGQCLVEGHEAVAGYLEGAV